MSCPGTWAGGFAETERGAKGEAPRAAGPGCRIFEARRCDQS
jgi:hypothetical protein